MDQTEREEREYEQSSASSTSHEKDHTAADKTHTDPVYVSTEETPPNISNAAAAAAPAPVDGGDIEKSVTNKSAAPSVNNIKSVPNGGTAAWLQVLGAFFLFFNSWYAA